MWKEVQQYFSPYKAHIVTHATNSPLSAVWYKSSIQGVSEATHPIPPYGRWGPQNPLWPVWQGLQISDYSGWAHEHAPGTEALQVQVGFVVLSPLSDPLLRYCSNCYQNYENRLAHEKKSHRDIYKNRVPVRIHHYHWKHDIKRALTTLIYFFFLQ